MKKYFRKYNKIFIILTVFLISPTLSYSTSQKDACVPFSEIAERVALLRDLGHSQSDILDELKTKTKMNERFANNLVASTFEEMKKLAPDAVKYMYFKYCSDYPDVLHQALPD